MLPSDPISVTGEVKWFDPAKGYGFIVPDNGLSDVLVHINTLRRDGFEGAYEGMRVVVEDAQTNRGLQASRILSMDESTARTPVPRTHVKVIPTSGLERVQVKWFNRKRGFGFVNGGEGMPDIFVHMETLRSFGMSDLTPDQYVLVRFGQGPKGLMVAEIRPTQAGVSP